MFHRYSRNRRAGALLGAALVVGGLSVGSLASADSTTIPFSDGFESGNTTVWPRKGIDGTGTVDVVAAPGGHAGKAARFTMPDQGNSYRTEIATSRLPYGSYRYTFSNYLPQNWISYEAQTIVSQWHGGEGTDPAVVLAVKADRWMMIVHWIVGSEPLNEIKYDLGPVRLGHWNQWSFDITWSTATTPGSITAQLDGTQVGAHQGPNSYSQTTNAPHRDTVPYHKIGLYRPNWKAEKGHVNGGTPPVVIYYDNISITPISPTPTKPTTTPSVPSAATPTAPRPAPSSGQPHGGPSATPTAAPTLRRHDTGPEVVELQNRLAQIGSWDYPQHGTYGRNLQTAVQQFQQKQGVRDDQPGVYGPATRRILEAMTAER
ncbi:heparin lyase I family protein [Kitasatospora herbaricolor]|uniref:Heparin lyase I family protein n=1 Tax=Kitasatospora herbaricolor TaxID=68217 RepID=A0ABZ1WH13_9ACTN|nr:heparin lyase I family protein [Kitasatospora herbaricolor]